MKKCIEFKITHCCAACHYCMSIYFSTCPRGYVMFRKSYLEQAAVIDVVQLSLSVAMIFHDVYNDNFGSAVKKYDNTNNIAVEDIWTI